MRVGNIDYKKDQIDYGEGIVIVRLFENRI